VCVCVCVTSAVLAQLRCRNDSILSTLPEPPEKASLYRREREKEHDFHPRRSEVGSVQPLPSWRS